MSNPFNDVLDYSLRGKYVRVTGTDGETHEGWVARIHHQKGSVILYPGANPTEDDSVTDHGVAYVRTVDSIIELVPYHRYIEDARVDLVRPSPWHARDFDVSFRDVRGAYRDGFTGSFPVVRPVFSNTDGDFSHYELINGHKRIEACRVAGIDSHPVQVVEATDAQARELFEMAHDEDEIADGQAPEGTDLPEPIDDAEEGEDVEKDEAEAVEGEG